MPTQGTCTEHPWRRRHGHACYRNQLLLRQDHEPSSIGLRIQGDGFCPFIKQRWAKAKRRSVPLPGRAPERMSSMKGNKRRDFRFRDAGVLVINKSPMLHVFRQTRGRVDECQLNLASCGGPGCTASGAAERATLPFLAVEECHDRRNV
ncbi:hypothetical protein LCI18_007302 [Fusarium solani-melongenae]|uniref:Uncharacterized protein n=1 Tax=Fusarium solani subsp. cucurbitae TaxID=2747967 RepID=A0ACD3Z5J2_FUSSC|nr:hypothetical protein LCI18_007302 [Fusarium solani-melongenae]